MPGRRSALLEGHLIGWARAAEHFEVVVGAEATEGGAAHGGDAIVYRRLAHDGRCGIVRSRHYGLVDDIL